MLIRQFEWKDPDKALGRRDRWLLDLDPAKAQMRVGKLRSARINGLAGVTYAGGAGFKLSQTVGGLWVPAAANDPGESDAGFGSWEARTNSARNPTALGAVAGTPGTAPTNWSILPGPGLSSQVVGAGTEFGLPYVDIRLFGTSTSSAGSQIFPEVTTQVVASSGQTWTSSVFTRLVAGSLANVSTVAIDVAEYTAAGVFLAHTSSNYTPTAAISRAAASRTLSDPSVARVSFAAATVSPISGAAVDLTLRIYAPNLKLGADIADPPILQTNNLAATRTADSLVVQMKMPPEGIIFCEYDAPATVQSAATRRYLWSIEDGSSKANSRLYVTAADSNVALEPQGIVGDGTANTNISPPSNPAPGSRVRCALAYSTRNATAALAVNGGVSTAARGLDPATIAGAVSLCIGRQSAGPNNQVCTTIRRIAVIAGFATGAQLAGMTAL